jgi:hypothetical protein
MFSYQTTQKESTGKNAQPKLKIGQPGDKYEQEADAFADRVMLMGDTDTIQMQPEEEEEEMMQPKLRMQPIEEEEEPIQMKCAKCEKEKKRLQLNSDEGSIAAPSIEKQIHSSAGAGNKLPDSTNQFMSSAMGADLSGVQIHTGQNASAMNQQLGARAFTYGNNIYFNNGEYNPASSRGKNLLAHELTHTIQQGKVPLKIQADFSTEPINDAPVIIELTEDETNEAIRFNRTILNDEKEISVLRDVLGVSKNPAVIDEDLIRVIVSYQARNDIDQDGKIGPVTASRISMEYWEEARFLGNRKGRELRRMARRMDNRSFNISITRAAVSLTNRGSAEFGVQWSVPDDMANGWIIQHVRFQADIEDAASNPVASNNGGIEYWEGWEVQNGEVFIGQAAGGALHAQDTFRTINEPPNTRGQVRILGTVRFIPDYDLQIPPWGFTVPEAGNLPTMTVEPDGWVEAGARQHNLIVDYDDTVVPASQTINSRP